MAKPKTPTAAPAPAASATPTPSWLKTDAAAAPVAAEPAPVDNSASAPVAEKPSEERDQQTPTGENQPAALTPGADDAGAAGGNGGGTDDADQLDADEAQDNAPDDEETSIERDQETPVAPNPSKQVEWDAEQIDPASVVKAPPHGGERPSEVTDQVTPVGVDKALLLDDQRKVSLERSAQPSTLETIRDRMAALSDADQEELSSKLAEAAADILTTHERNAQAREMEVAMVDGTALYGNRARRENHNETLPGTANGNAERNRRARRAAQRVAAQTKAK